MAAHSDPASYGPPEKLLLVEGDDDKHFLWNLLEAHGIRTGVRVEDQGGYSRIRKRLPQLLRAGNQTHLGIIVDADLEPERRWAALRNVLIAAGYRDVPEKMETDGTKVGMIEPIPPPAAEPVYKSIVGIWMMPDNGSGGMLEDFAFSLIPPEDALWPRAAEAVAAIPPDQRLFVPTATAKANLHTWLAWQENPGHPIGRAVKADVLKHHSEPAQNLVNWLRDLFDLAAPA